MDSNKNASHLKWTMCLILQSILAVSFLVKKFQKHILHYCDDVLTFLDKQIGHLLWTQDSQRMFMTQTIAVIVEL